LAWEDVGVVEAVAEVGPALRDVPQLAPRPAGVAVPLGVLLFLDVLEVVGHPVLPDAHQVAVGPEL